ncbi:tetratricopeptide repeat protein [Salibacteraceae bacterium]|jgi:tetratricopeptide (TPR) repeat protein|nr:tetratricopeptide repeat protein [Salibacteraceae bacterium]MDB9709308.1 tetratricopeptide repeat protein [Salibacteraceae bacterium]
MNKEFIFLLVMGLTFASCQENNTAKLESDQPQSSAFKNEFDSISSLILASPNDPELYFERAKAHYGNKDLVSSLSDIGRSLKLDSSNTEYYMLFADLKLLQKESRASRDALLKALEIDPNNVDVLIRLGELYMVVQDAEESFKYLNQALKLDVFNSTAYRLKGFNYKYLRDTTNAVSSFQTAIEQDPNDYDSYLQLGLLYSSIEHDIALEYYDNALKVRPTSFEALYAKGLHFQVTENSRSAINTYREIISINEAYFDAWYNIGYVYLEQLNEYDSAALSFSKAIEVGPKNYVSAIYNKGLSHERAGELEQAKKEYEKALAANPQYDLAARGLSRILNE